MLEVFVNLLCPVIMMTAGIYIAKRIINSKCKILTFKNIILIIGYAIVNNLIKSVDYKGINTIITFLINIGIYKVIFKENIGKMTVLASIVMILTFIADMFCGIFLILFFTSSEFRSIWYLKILANIMTALISITITKLLTIKIDTEETNLKLEKLSNYSTLIFMGLTIIVFTIVTSSFAKVSQFNNTVIINIVLVTIFLVLLIIFLLERNSHNNLINDYDNLFLYIQNFEDWIDKEQLNYHEYKNQLAVLRCLTKEIKVKEKIDEILEDNINIEEQAVTNFKNLPKGGIKGLMYYKAAIAQKKKIKLTTDVCLTNNGLLTKLTEKEIRILCKLIGIYFDNAIEATIESKRKKITIEVYEIKGKVTFIFSNTFKIHKNIKDRNKKGISSKGKGRGNGLYFAQKIINENNWLFQKQEIIDNYYIQKLEIKKH